MTATPAPTQRRGPPTPAEINARQKADAERDRQRKADAARAAEARYAAPVNPAAGTTVAPAAKPVPATMPPDNRSPLDKYLDEIAPSAIVGRMVSYNSKERQYRYRDDDTTIDEDVDLTVFDDQVMASWLRFHGKGEQPERIGSLLSDGFVLPPRASLGDADPATWETGLDGRPQDPWVHQLAVVMQRADSGEVLTFVTNTGTGRRAIGVLLKHTQRLHRTHPDTYAVIRLKHGGFNHRDERIGWVNTPTFAVVGRAPKDSVAKPDTSPQADFDDAIPY